MQDRAFLVKCYNECNSNERCAFQRHRSIREIRRGSLTSQSLRKMMTKFEATSSLSVECSSMKNGTTMKLAVIPHQTVTLGECNGTG